MTSDHCCPGEQPIRVLIADDAPRSRDGLRALLATVRFKSPVAPTRSPWSKVEVVGEAANGQQAVCLTEECQPDVVLMDARMPIVDGLEATRLIKNKWPGIKVIVLTMYPTYRAEALAAGADAFIVKGCPPEDLLEAILGE